MALRQRSRLRHRAPGGQLLPGQCEEHEQLFGRRIWRPRLRCRAARLIRYIGLRRFAMYLLTRLWLGSRCSRRPHYGAARPTSRRAGLGRCWPRCHPAISRGRSGRTRQRACSWSCLNRRIAVSEPRRRCGRRARWRGNGSCGNRDRLRLSGPELWPQFWPDLVVPRA